MNCKLPYIPQREIKPRNEGKTFVSESEFHYLDIDNTITTAADFIDCIIFNESSLLLGNNVKEKIEYYKTLNIDVSISSLVFALYIARNKFEDYTKLLGDNGITVAEVSDIVLAMDFERKLQYISKLRKDFKVISHINIKYLDNIEDIIYHISQEFFAGANMVCIDIHSIGEHALVNSEGKLDANLLKTIVEPFENNLILFNSNNTDIQISLIKLFGNNVNLYNVQITHAIELEMIRTGLHSRTFFDNMSICCMS